MISQPEVEQPTGFTTATLWIYLLGPPGTKWAGHPLPIPRRQVRALLYRLAARLQPVPREHLCFLFWPDTSESIARRNLSHLLTHLRRILPMPEMLVTSEDYVGLTPHLAWSDTVAFERLCAALIPHPLRPLSPLPMLGEGRGSWGEWGEGLQQAVDLYRGPFLAGFSLSISPEFEAWATQERHIWEHKYLKVLEALIEEWTARGEYDVAITYARRYLQTDDLDEDMHRRLIELYAAAGDRSSALRQFERCVAVLERELGVSPLPETRTAYQAVLEGRPSPLQRPVIKPTWTTLPSLEVPLVGRDDVLRQLKWAYVRSRFGYGGVVLISGEAGIGKSRLMQDFVTGLEGKATVVVGGGYEAEQGMPYWPLVEALRPYLPAINWTALDIEPSYLAEVARLLPELRTLIPDLPTSTSVDPGQEQGRLFQALTCWLLSLAVQHPPLILCLDDLQWADEATLSWLGYLARHLKRAPILVLGAYRTEEAAAVATLRTGLVRLGILQEIRLEGLPQIEVLRLVRHLSGQSSGAELFSQRLHQETGGSPFFLLETLRAMFEAGILWEDEAGWSTGVDEITEDYRELPLPDTVYEVIRDRLRRLSPQARQVLEAGAVVGHQFDFELVRATSGRREGEVVDALDTLLARQVISEHEGSYRFNHDLIRAVVKAGLSPVRRQLLHRRAGRALEQLDPDAVATLARHFDAGGEEERALHYYAQAARRAEALFAWREAEGYQSRMLALLDRLDPDRTQPDFLMQRGQLLAARAHQRYLQARLMERDADLAVLTALAEASGHKSLYLQALIHRARHLNLDAQYKRAIATAEEGLALADHLHDEQARSRLLAQIGFAHYFLGQPRRALTALESTPTMAAEEADPEMRGRIAHILGYVYFHLGNFAQSLAYQQEAYACHRTVNDHNRMALDGLDIGALHLEMGRFAEAKQYLTENLALARRIGARPAEAYGLTLLGCWELHQGDYAAAAECFRQALSMQEGLRSEHGCVAAELGRGLASCHLGDLIEARCRLKHAIERARSIGHRRRLAEALIRLGLVEIADGQPSVARCCLTEAVAVARDSECRENLAAGLAALARVERQQGDPASALSHAREAVSVARESSLPVCEMWGEMEVGLTLLAQGKPMAALEHTGRAVTLVPQAHEGWIGTEQAHRAHAMALRTLGRAEAADEQAWRAEAIVEAKAGRIPDPQHRQRYLQSVQRET